MELEITIYIWFGLGFRFYFFSFSFFSLLTLLDVVCNSKFLHGGYSRVCSEVTGLIFIFVSFHFSFCFSLIFTWGFCAADFTATQMF